MDKEQELLKYLRKIYTDWLNKNGNAMRPETLDEQLALYLINKEHEISKLKEEKKQVFTDIRDYLVTAKVRVANSDIFVLQIREVEKFADKALAYLTEYAEKLGVEL